LGEAPYDPFSAAELQMQALMGPSKPTSRKGSSLGASGLGLGISMMDSVRMEGTGQESPEFDFDMGLAEFEKEYLSSKDRSPDYRSSNHGIINEYGSYGTNLGRSGSCSGLELEPTIGSPLPRRASDNWSWKSNPNTPSGRWSVGTASPTLKKPSWASPRESLHSSGQRNNLSNLTSSFSQENLSKVHRWSSPSRETSKDTSNWAPLSNPNWSLLTHDIQNWSSTDEKNKSPSPNRGTRSWASPIRDSRSKSPPVRDSSSDGHTWLSPNNENQSSLQGTDKLSSRTYDSQRGSSPIRDSLSESLAGIRSWASPTRDRQSPTHDILRRDSHCKSSSVRESGRDPNSESQLWSSLARDRLSASPSPVRDSNRWSSPTRDNKKDCEYERQSEPSPTRDTYKWSSPTRDHDISSPSPTGRSWSSPSRDNYKESSPTRDRQSSPTTTNKQKSDTCSSTHNWLSQSHGRQSVSPVRDTHKWSSLRQDSTSVSNSKNTLKSNLKSWGENSLNNTTQCEWSDELNSGLSSLNSTFNKYLRNTSPSTQRHLLSIGAPDGASGGGLLPSSNIGYETYRTSQDKIDSAT
ncbi:hypothetical protein SK128_027992, partial [Halocaridina rubra]